MNPRQLLAALYVVLFSGLVLGAGIFLYDARREYLLLKASEAAIRQRLADKQAQLKEQQRILERLKSDRDYVEKVIRRRLNYVKPGEMIFKFED